MLAVGLTVLLTTIAAWQMPLLMELMNISDELYADSYSYIIIITYGIVAMMMYNLLACICRALGDSRTPLYFLILSSVLNVVLALVFIMQFGWGVPGSAIALVIAQACRPCCASVICAAASPCCDCAAATGSSTGNLPGSICAWACPWPCSS